MESSGSGGGGPAPSELEHGRGEDGARDVPDGGVRVPHPHDGVLRRVAEPVPHDGDDARPACGLDDATGVLRGQEEGESVDVEEVGGAERGARGARRDAGRPRQELAEEEPGSLTGEGRRRRLELRREPAASTGVLLP